MLPKDTFLSHLTPPPTSNIVAPPAGIAPECDTHARAGGGRGGEEGGSYHAHDRLHGAIPTGGAVLSGISIRSFCC